MIKSFRFPSRASNLDLKAFDRSQGETLYVLTKIIVEMNPFFSSVKAFKAPFYMHRMCVVYPLSDNSIIKNKPKDKIANVNGQKSLTFIENNPACTGALTKRLCSATV